jgi:hypothetical protein
LEIYKTWRSAFFWKSGVNTAIDNVEYVGDGYPLVKAGDIRENFDIGKIGTISRYSFEKIPDHQKPKEGDILYANIGSRLGNQQHTLVLQMVMLTLVTCNSQLISFSKELIVLTAGGTKYFSIRTLVILIIIISVNEII